MNVDKFGTRVGTFGATVNALLGNKPKKMATLVEEGDLKWTAYDHLTKLVRKGLVTKTDEGYAVAKKTDDAKAAKNAKRRAARAAAKAEKNLLA